MASRVVMPKLSDTMEEGRILRWLKSEGDAIETGQALAEVETDKATVEMEAYANGTIRKLVATEGQFVKVGDLIAIIGAPDEDISALVPAAGAAAACGCPGARARTRPGAEAAAAGRAAGRRRGRARADRPQPQGLAARAAHGRRSRPRPGPPAGHRAAGPHHQAGHRIRPGERARRSPVTGRVAGGRAAANAVAVARCGARSGPREPGRRALRRAPHHRETPGPEQGPGAALLPDDRRGHGPRVGRVQGAPRSEVVDQRQRHHRQGRGARVAAASRDQRVVRRRSHQGLLPGAHRRWPWPSRTGSSRRSCATPT